jgi:hypothetical protein
VWENVDLESKSLMVKVSLSREENPSDETKNVFITAEVKTKKSKHNVPLPDFL